MMSVLKGERASYQIAYSGSVCYLYNIKIESDIKEHLRVYNVLNVPVERAVHSYNALTDDDNYISKIPGMYPDIFSPMEDKEVKAQYHYKGIWIETDENVPLGKHNIKITFSNKEESVSTTLYLEVLKAELPKQELKYHCSVHGDCIANYYNLEVFSERHWEMLEKFIAISAEYGSNMLTVPIFTPPVDTYVGGERLTVQLVDITKKGSKYTFNFDKFKRYIEICQNAGIEYFIMPQFFTQWGAKCAPKFIVEEDGELKKMFGWDVASTDEGYLDFLSQFIPELITHIKELGIEEITMFSISDEPFDDETIKRYSFLSEFLSKYIKNFKTIDAFSSYEHYKKSGAQMPLIPTNVIEDFEGRINTDELWVYYCCAQDYLTSNRFIAMPLYRNRC